jgi:hypothetical protein
MSKKCYRFYGGLLTSQEKWLNGMAERGYRLIRAEKLLYEFEACKPGQYQYRLEFVGQKSKPAAEDYARFLEDCGYRVFFKNINLNYSIGKVRWRPWAEQGGQLATNATTFNRELLIVEKENDGKAFALHTTYEDKRAYYKNLRKPWLFFFLVSAILGIALRALVWAVFAAISLAALAVYQFELIKLKKQAKTKEW